MRFRGLILVCSIAIIPLMLGCASMGGGVQVSGINWALEKNGGKVSAFTEEPDHPASTLINGVTSSEAWDQGEGWQAPISMGGGRRSRTSTGSDRARNWVMIELAQPVTVDRVRIYTIDSEDYPAREFGVSDLLIEYETESVLKEKLWIPVERFGKGIGAQDNTVRDNASGVIDVRFKPVNTQKIRFLIYRTNDLARTEDGSRTMQGMIRLTEVEVYGMGEYKSQDQLDRLFE